MATNLSGRVVAVTGANSGIGFETAKELAARGAQVHLLCRNETRGTTAVESIQTEFPDADVKLWLVDVSSFERIDTFLERFDANHHFKFDLLQLCSPFCE